MKNILLGLALFLWSFVFGPSPGSEGIHSGTNSFNDSLEMSRTVFYHKMSVLFPPSYIKESDSTSGGTFDILYFDSPDSTVWVKIRREKAKSDDLETYRKVCEFMAPRFYKGEVHRSEYLTIHGRNVYYFEMTGYWNKSKGKESWMRFYVMHEGYLYWVMIKFPERDREASAALRRRMVESLDFI